MLPSQEDCQFEELKYLKTSMYKKLIILGDIWRHCVKFKGIKAARRLSLLCIVDKENRKLFSLAYMRCKGMVMCVIQKKYYVSAFPFQKN